MCFHGHYRQCFQVIIAMKLKKKSPSHLEFESFHFRALRDFEEKLSSRLPIQATENRGAAPKTYNLRQSTSQEDVRPKKNRDKQPEQSITSNSGDQTEETRRPKRKCTTNLNPFVKLARIDVRAYSQEFERSNSHLGLYCKFVHFLSEFQPIFSNFT